MLASVMFLLTVSVVVAEVRLSHVFGDNIVLQRDMPVPIWGLADPDEEVKVSFAGQIKQATADKEGSWMVKLEALEASAKPQVLTVEASNTLKFSNVVVGGVWICRGQSNMAWRVRQSANCKCPFLKYVPGLPASRTTRSFSDFGAGVKFRP